MLVRYVNIKFAVCRSSFSSTKAMDASDIFKKLSFGAKIRKEIGINPNRKQNVIKTDSDCDSIDKPPKKSRIKSQKIQHDFTPDSTVRLLDEWACEQFEGDAETAPVKGKRKQAPKEREMERNAQTRNKHHISVIGKNIPGVCERFEDFKENFQLSSTITKNLLSSGYDGPTPIQMQAIPLLLQGRQVLACAPTGSGKTAAFLVPIIHHLRASKKGGFRGVVVCPTRELASQSYRECLRLSSGTGLRSLVISKISHTADDTFNKKAANCYDILFTTPNRLVHLLQQEPSIVSLKLVEWLIVDECDKLFEAGVRGFRDQLAVIYTACESTTVKRAMFSATQSPPLTKWCRKNLTALITINVGVRNTTCEDVDQELMFVGNEQGKLVAFRDIARKGLSPPVLVFVQSKERAQELFSELVYDGINVDVIHSDRTQAQRDNVIRSFREGKIWVLICTELMGRGIDFKGVNLVINYDFPPSTVAYIHRVGRTGRAGRKGRAITFFTLDDTTNLRSIARVVKESGGNVPDYMLSMRKPTKREKRALEKHAPDRESIATTSIYEEMRKEKKLKAIKRSQEKKKKLKSQ